MRVGPHGSMWVLAWFICVHVYVRVGACGCVWVHVWSGVVAYATVWACVALFGWLVCRVSDYNMT